MVARNDLSTQPPRDVIAVYAEAVRQLMLMMFNADVSDPREALRMVQELRGTTGIDFATEDFGGMYDDLQNMAEDLWSAGEGGEAVTRWTGKR